MKPRYIVDIYCSALLEEFVGSVSTDAVLLVDETTDEGIWAFLSLLLLNVDMIVDVILAVAVVPLALTAIAEFQLWIRYIRAATHGAAMVIVLLFLLLLWHS